MRDLRQLSYAGAHDKPPPGLTDLPVALADLRAVAGGLKVTESRPTSVDTSNPATDRHRKSGHHAGELKLG